MGWNGGLSSPGAIGSRIRRRRRERGLTQTELARPRYTGAYVSQLEGGHRRPSAGALHYFAERLQVTEEQLLTGRAPELEVQLKLRVHDARRTLHAGDRDAALDTLTAVIKEAARAELDDVVAEARITAATASRKNGDVWRALEYLDAAEPAFSDVAPEARVALVVERARCLFQSGDTRYAIHVLESFLIELNRRAARHPGVLIQVYSALVGPYFESGLVGKAHDAAEQAQRLGGHVDDPEDLACMYINVAGMFLAEKRLDDAQGALQRAEAYFTQLDWVDDLAKTRIALAMTLVDKNELDDGRDVLMSLLDLPERSITALDRGRALNQLGRIHRLADRTKEAITALEEAAGILQGQDLDERALNRRELALCHLQNKDDGAAARHLLESVDLYRAANNPLQTAMSFKLLGDIHLGAGDDQDALSVYRDGLEAALSGTTIG